MTKQVWLNLPVKNLQRSRDFFTQIGFSLNPKHGNTEVSASILIGEKPFVLMLFLESAFQGIVGNSMADTSKVSEVLISIDAESREEVNELAEKVKNAGGSITHPPSENQGWMYGFSFADLDGHRWNVLFMDMTKMSF